MNSPSPSTNPPDSAAPMHWDAYRMALALDDARRMGVPILQWAKVQELSLAQAYRVQAEGMRLRRARGERQLGWKLAFTNRALMARLGVAAPVLGRLCRDMQVAEGAELPMATLQRPRVEAEVAFRIARPLLPGIDAAQALAGVDAVAAALEIVDSRYRDFQFSLPDVVADNASACAFVLGPWQRQFGELAGLEVLLEIDGAEAARGSSSAILDHPVQALLAAMQLAADAGQPLGAGDIVLAGSATEPVALAPGMQVRASVATLGAVSFRAGGKAA